MRVLLLILIVYLVAVMETALVDVMRIGEVTPDLLALTGVVWLLTSSGPRAFLVAGAIALAGDLIAPGRVGTGAAWMLLVGYALTRLKSRLPLDRLAGQVLATWAAVTAWAMAVGISGRLTGDVALPTLTVLARAAAVGLYTAGVGLPVLMVAGWIREPHLARQRRLAAF